MGSVACICKLKIPESLAPDYNCPFPQVYKDLALFIIKHIGHMDIFLCVAKDLEGVPSWVPDFRRTLYREEAQKALTTSSVIVTPDLQTIWVQGYQIGERLSYLGREKLRSNFQQLKSRVHAFEDAIFADSALIRDISATKAWKAYFEQIFPQVLGFQTTPQVLQQLYDMYMSIAVGEPTARKLISEHTRRTDQG